MAVLPSPSTPTHELPGTRFTSLATPTRGCVDTAIWQVEIAPGTAATPPHRMTREEVFVVLEGTAKVLLSGVEERASTGDVIVVPTSVDFTLSNDGDGVLRMLCCLPVGGQVEVDGEGDAFTPPWAI